MIQEEINEEFFLQFGEYFGGGEPGSNDYGTIVFKREDDEESTTVAMTSLDEFVQLTPPLIMQPRDNYLNIGGETFTINDILEVHLGEAVTGVMNDFLATNVLKLTTFTFPETIKYIGMAFCWNAHDLTEIELPASVETIREFFLHNAVSLTKLVVNCPPTVLTEGNRYFLEGCYQEIAISGPYAQAWIDAIPRIHWRLEEE